VAADTKITASSCGENRSKKWLTKQDSLSITEMRLILKAEVFKSNETLKL